MPLKIACPATWGIYARTPSGVAQAAGKTQSFFPAGDASLRFARVVCWSGEF